MVPNLLADRNEHPTEIDQIDLVGKPEWIILGGDQYQEIAAQCAFGGNLMQICHRGQNLVHSILNGYLFRKPGKQPVFQRMFHQMF